MQNDFLISGIKKLYSVDTSSSQDEEFNGDKDLIVNWCLKNRPSS